MIQQEQVRRPAELISFRVKGVENILLKDLWSAHVSSLLVVTINGRNMKKIFCFIILLSSMMPSNAQYITQVLEYQPAPGQLINESPWGVATAASSIVGTVTGTMSLGAFGGYVVFKFANPVENHVDNPYGVDFTIFGNASLTSSEPGIVSVMKDENNNGLADDTWYELAGSDYFFSSTINNYTVTYVNPNESVAADVAWSDNFGGSGTLTANPFHTQAYYPLSTAFPLINTMQYTLSGTKIKEDIDRTVLSMIKSNSRPFGYADNRPRGTAPYTIPDNPYTLELENAGGDAFDIAWAVDANGDYVDLDAIDFVKVHNAVQSDMGWLGEASTEITGAVDVAPNSSINGRNEMLVISALPDTIRGTQFQLETAVFRNARFQEGAALNWVSNLVGASVDIDNKLSFTASGALSLTASLVSNASITETVSTVLVYDTNVNASKEINATPEIVIYPNPATDYIYLQSVQDARISLMNTIGIELLSIDNYKGEAISISHLPTGVYILLIRTNDRAQTIPLIKE